MQAEQVDLVEVGRQRFIERPRLTRLLDESEARIQMLIAPAGYGKTTLARQWLATRQHGWYRGGSGSADVAAVAFGLSAASRGIVPGAGERMQERLRATGTPEEDVVALAEMLAEDLQEWPEDAWLVFDDYQFACRSRFSERFVDLLVSLTPLRFLLTSRLRPSWATSRRLLYGEVHEIGRTFLAMTDEEAVDVLGERERANVAGLVALAEGWPAVIGLASLTEGRTLPEAPLPSTLYDYFAEELYQAAPPALQWQLCQLALVPSFTTELAEALLGPASAKALVEGVRLGFFTTPGRDVYDTHRLLRTFLESKFREAPESQTSPITQKLGRALAERGRWDDAFDVVERFFREELFLELIELALPSVLREGRLPTLDGWVEFGVTAGVDAPVLNLAEAESRFRKGERTRAESLAVQASRQMDRTDSLRVRAMLLAGSSAHLNHRLEEAMAYYAEALESATEERDRWEAVRGQAVSASVLERPDAIDLVEQLASLNDGSAEREATVATVRFHFDYHRGMAAGAAERLEALSHLGPRIRNPIRQTSFLYQVAAAYLHNGHYQIVPGQLEKARLVAKEHRLTFVLPYLSLLRARAELGLHNFSRSRRLLEALSRIATRHDNHDICSEVIFTKSRLFLAEGLFDRAAEVLEEVPELGPPPGEYGEYLLGRALALACLGETDLARDLADRGARHTKALEAQTLAPFVIAISAIRDGHDDAHDLALRACRNARMTGGVDSFVSAYRGWPKVLEQAARDDELKRWVAGVLRNARDDQIAAHLGLPRIRRAGDVDLLSPREHEVFDLLVQGLTNRQIARALWISESTAKVHVRHIFEKLGVRSRVEATLKASKLNLQATSASSSSE